MSPISPRDGPVYMCTQEHLLLVGIWLRKWIVRRRVYNLGTLQGIRERDGRDHHHLHHEQTVLSFLNKTTYTICITPTLLSLTVSTQVPSSHCHLYVSGNPWTPSLLELVVAVPM